MLVRTPNRAAISPTSTMSGRLLGRLNLPGFTSASVEDPYTPSAVIVSHPFTFPNMATEWVMVVHPKIDAPPVRVPKRHYELSLKDNGFKLAKEEKVKSDG